MQLKRRDAGAKAGHGSAEAGLVQLENIQRSLHKQRRAFLADLFRGLIQTKDQAIALKQQIASAVAVLGLLATSRPAAEAHGLP